MSGLEAATRREANVERNTKEHRIGEMNDGMAARFVVKRPGRVRDEREHAKIDERRKSKLGHNSPTFDEARRGGLYIREHMAVERGISRVRRVEGETERGK
jgi:hypothetical protein